MNSNSIKKLTSILVLVTIFTACVQDDDFKIPALVIEEPTIDSSLIIGVDAVLGAIAQAGDDPVNYEDTDKFMSGYVVSTDRAGNFFEELIIQDKPENPTAGIRVLIDVNPLFTSYEFGRKVFIKLAGLSAAIENGVATLGVLSNRRVGQIPLFSQEAVIIRSAEVATITPLEIKLSDFSDAVTNMYVKVNNIQFTRNEVLGEDGPLTFAGEASDQFNGERTVESCDIGWSAIVSTSTFADFKSLTLPTQQGSFEGILKKNFFGEEFNLVLNDPTGLVFDNENRCDPQEVSCGLADKVGATPIFSDDFETQSRNNPITGNGWTNFIETGAESWEAWRSTATNSSLGISARAGAFDVNTLAWLITPAIDLDAQEGETLRFRTSSSFADGSELELLISNDWDGDPDTIISATWDVLTDPYVVQDSDFFGDWFDSGTVDISCETGTVHIAFRYRGSGNENFDGIYELDEISIDAN